MLKTVIDESGESQKVWAERLGVSGAYMSLLVNGKKQPSLELAVRIDRVTGGKVPATSWVPDDSQAATQTGDAA
ncbi:MULTISPECIES: helix-turn-helix domain-containing protein [Mameliella]|uniref:HTH cro/C1-type domain-containing protein n=1 Tax=Mameliella alba TaxID=561184 RepID=A0A0B3RR36_9RHOB|nr:MULTISPECIES: helix-turn-helix transcriptional regulator [Mameliella]KHQ50357.1 hypothetical protein OA50_05032 [Mameliella alba]MBW4983686.1 helix-turn-helix transcriptional regulator [Mameliella sp. CS4]ODM45543.1 hypothetical protein A9320_27735 [Ruegeria sp. PBVC088]